MGFVATLCIDLADVYKAQGNTAKAQKYEQKAAAIKAQLQSHKVVAHDNEFLQRADIFKLAIDKGDGADLLNRLIKIAVDSDGKETDAVCLLIQAFDKGGEEALRNTLIR
ncbi:MAG: hypothetical protein MRQ07_05465 [Candidatus Midichloria sp.]|nr:hypothetical protein [Candidatus Midichloria sp.]